MRLLALRVQAFRRFAGGAAIENFGSGVNLLAGPNELGKSTLFEALEAAFLVRYGTTGAVLEHYRPRSGGEPLVEVDFEIADKTWRIRKQFGRGKTAILSDPQNGRIIARAGDAEDQLAQLTGVTSEGPGRVGLVWVRQQRALQAPDPDVDPLTGKAKGRGESNALMAALGDEVVEAAGSGAAEAVGARVGEALARFVTPGRDVAKKGGPYDAALKDRLAAREALVRAREAAAASDQRLALIAELTARLGELDAPERGPQSAARIAALERAIADAAGLRARRDVAAAELATLQLEAEQARRFVLDCETKTARLATLRQTQAEAGVLEAEIKTLANVINADGATPARLQRIVSFETAINLAQAELGHPGAIVDIALLSGGENKITAGGAPVTAATRITVSERLDLVIEGIGTIRVAAADAGKAAAARRRHEDASTSLVQALGEIGAETVEVAREKTEQRRARVEALDVARARLSGLAPRGAMAVDEELTGLKAALASLDMATLQRNAEACELTALEARRALETIMATAADDARFRKLSSDLEAERREASRRVEEARRASEQLERLKGEQAGVDEDGRAGDVEKAGGALQFAEAEVARIEDEIAALKLLSQTLARAVDGVRTRYFEPVARALHPYLAEIFPESALAFRDGFSLEGLTRAGEREDFATLSDGTREQLAVLVRMGFAQVFAARGTPVPLVLDDPLVYSDDQRLAAMCRALVGAGQQFQVIVLTCRETAFQQLAGQRLTLVPWQGG